MRKSNTNFEGSLAVGITVFLAFLFSLRVSQAFVGFGDLDELGCGLRVVGIPVRVELQSQLTVSFLNLHQGGIMFHAHDLVGVEADHGRIFRNVGISQHSGGQTHQDNDKFDKEIRSCKVLGLSLHALGKLTAEVGERLDLIDVGPFAGCDIFLDEECYDQAGGDADRNSEMQECSVIVL